MIASKSAHQSDRDALEVPGTEDALDYWKIENS